MNNAIDPHPRHGPTCTFRHARGRRRWTAVAAIAVASVVIAGGGSTSILDVAIGSDPHESAVAPRSHGKGVTTLLQIDLGLHHTHMRTGAVAIPAFLKNARKAKTAELELGSWASPTGSAAR